VRDNAILNKGVDSVNIVLRDCGSRAHVGLGQTHLQEIKKLNYVTQFGFYSP
jgi:hypothetical protein